MTGITHNAAPTATSSLSPVEDLLGEPAARLRAPWAPGRGEPVVVYGAGSFARAVIRVLRAAGAQVRYALDQRADSIATADGVRVHRPGGEPAPAGERSGLTAVVAVFNRDADIAGIEETLRQSGYRGVVSPAELYETFHAELGERFWLAPRAEYERAAPRIALADELWADATSRELYRALLRHRVAWEPAALPRPSSGRQYFPADLPPLAGVLSFVDCGAYTGDTLREAHAAGVRFGDLYAFEPDPENFAALAGTARDLSAGTGARANLWPCAVSDRTGRQQFAAAAGEASRLADDGGETVTTVALDDAIVGASPTYLKMDIEGAEPAALRGAARLIRRSRPRLAICVYHRPNHLWEIPLQVRDLGVSYDLYLRCHGHCGFDVVLYAVPRRSA